MSSGSPCCCIFLLLLAFTLEEEESWAEARIPLTRGPKLLVPGQETFLGRHRRSQGRGGGPSPSLEGAPHTSRGMRVPKGPGKGQATEQHALGETEQPRLPHLCPPGSSGLWRHCQSWMVKVGVLGVLGLLVMGGNGLAVAVLASSVSGWSRSSRLTLLSLAASDAALAVLVVPLNLYRSLELGPAAPEEAAGEGGPSAYCRAVAFVNSSLFGASLYSLAGVSLERYVAVFFPLRYGRLLSRRRVALLIAAAWLLPAVLLAPLAVPGPAAVLRVRFSAAALLCEPDYGSNALYSLWIAGTVFCPAAGTVAFTNLRLWRVARSQRRRGRGAALLGKAGGARRLRLPPPDAAARVLLPVVVAFFVCWAPCIGTIVYNSVTQERVHEWVEFVALWLPIGSGFLNCFVYFWVNRNFRHKFQKIGQKLCLPCCPTEQEPWPQRLQTISAKAKEDHGHPGLAPVAPSVCPPRATAETPRNPIQSSFIV